MEAPNLGSNKKNWPRSLIEYVRTSETLMGESSPALPSSQVDFLASLSVAPGSDEARKMTVTSGRRCCALSKRQDPLGYLERTLLESSTWNSTRCYLTWKAKATPQGRLLFQLAVSMPCTDETESGLWRTPDTEADGRGEYKDPEKILQRWEKGHQITLSNQVKMWPTATSGAHKDAGNCENVTDNGLLGRVVGPTKASGSLNPQFVEWLMGYPLGWTDLKDSETQSSRKSHTKS
jgi:hypothetical protein